VPSVPSSAAEAPAIVVVGTRDTGATQITDRAQKLIDVPGAIGDPLSAVFSLPGIVYSGGDTGEPAVRGSGPADNLYIVDSLPVPYVFHVLDIGESVFSDNVLRSFDLYAAGFGPQYANATGGVFDIGLRDPKNEPLSATVDISGLRSGIFVETALTEQSAAYLSARESMLHLFIKSGTTSDGIVLESPPKDTDYQFKYVWHVDDQHKLTVAANGASDSGSADFTTQSQFAEEYPDAAGSARFDSRYNYQSLAWEYLASEGSRLRLALSHDTDDNETRYGEGYYYDERLSQDIAHLQSDASLTSNHTLHVTGDITRNEHEARFYEVLYVCNDFDPTCVDTRHGIVTGSLPLIETEKTFSASDTWQLGSLVTVDLGAQVHANSFTGEHFYNPRGAATWQVATHSSIIVRAGTYDEFPQLNTVLPEIGNPHLRESRADHFSAGFKQGYEQGWSWSVEGYHKKLWDLPLALDSSLPNASQLYRNQVSGRAYGVDLLIDKSRADTPWSGWFAVSLAKSTRTDEITGATSDYYLDTPFLMNTVVNYQWSQTVDFGARLTVRSGQPDTPITGVRENPYFPDDVLPVYGKPYSTRLPTYYRLDLRLKRQFMLGRYPSSISVNIINALNTKNVTAQQLNYASSRVGQPPQTTRLDDDLPFLPAVTLRILF
jgi:hypothetical protein